MNKNNRWKFPKVVFAIFLVVFLCLYLQYAYLALSPSIYGINMDSFAAQRSTFSTVLSAKRGNIYDIDSNILATNISSYTVIAYLDPNRSNKSTTLLHVVDKEFTAKSLAPILNMEEDYILELLNRDVKQVELGPGGRGITELTKEAIENLNLPGIDFIESQKRYYPNGNFASYIIGYARTVEVDTNGDDVEDSEEIEGELGIESKYDEMLRGTDGYISYQKDRFGYKIPDTKEEKVDAVNGDDIYLTLDSNIQRFTESAVKEATEEYDPEWMFIMVMDAKTGDILASSSSPSFDPNIRDITNYENPLSSYVYEPGSVMKTYTYMCAIEKGTYVGSQTFLSGSIVVDNEGSVISDWNPSGWGMLTYDQGYAYSSNVGITNILKNFIDKNDLRDCLDSYGFGKQTGVELARELTGSIEFNYPVEIAAAGFGQGITITPIQQLQALTIIANDGIMLKPHIISKIVDPNTGEILYESSREELGQIVSKATTDKIKELMDDAVNASWAPTSAASFKIDGLNVIGKSGTAQIFNNITNSYEAGANDYVFSFAGMFPGDNPDIIIYAAMKKPTHSTAIGIIKATKSVMENVGKYLQLTDDSENDLEEITLTSYINKDISILDDLKDTLNVVVIGDGQRIINQYPSSGKVLLEGEKLFIITNASTTIMPNLKGYSESDAKVLLGLLDIDYTIEGYGYVTSQSISSGQIVDGVVNLVLENKSYIEEESEEES
ncbi:MAG: penicillin-binding protein [Bacilli bacterium]|nr:penicillin-binding protein [Bacilli bacterium]